MSGTKTGELIKSYRLTKGLTITAVADLCKVSRPHLSRMEHGKATPTAELAVRLERAIDLPRWRTREDLYIVGKEQY